MRTLPEDDSDHADLARLNVEPWMAEHLKLNPEYVHWGPGEDYMSTKGESWEASQEVSGWSAFGPWELDELNECVHFYFELERPSEKCAQCDASGYNSETKVIVRVRNLSAVDAEAVTQWLAKAAERNAQRFGKVARKEHP